MEQTYSSAEMKIFKSNENDKDNFIQLLTAGYSFMLENYQTINAEYDLKHQEIKDIEHIKRRQET